MPTDIKIIFSEKNNLSNGSSLKERFKKRFLIFFKMKAKVLDHQIIRYDCQL